MKGNLPLQNTPLRTELGKKLREAFTSKEPPPPVDYAEIELRALAQLEGFPEFVDMHKKDKESR